MTAKPNDAQRTASPSLPLPESSCCPLVISGAVELSIVQKAIHEPAQMFLLGICLLGLAGYGRRIIYKK